jgi:hypothetical protein
MKLKTRVLGLQFYTFKTCISQYIMIFHSEDAIFKLCTVWDSNLRLLKSKLHHHRVLTILVSEVIFVLKIYFVFGKNA